VFLAPFHAGCGSCRARHALRWLRLWATLLLGGWLVLVAPPGALAQEQASAAAAAAEQRLAQAEQLRSEGHYREALTAFQDAYRLSPSAPALQAAAELYRAFGDDAAAHRAYAALLRKHRAEMSEESQRSAEQELRQLDLLTGTIVVAGFAPGATVTINGALIGTTPLSGAVRVNPGQYTVTVARAGFQTLTRTVQVGSGSVSVSGPLQPQVSTGDVSVLVDLPVVTQLYIDGRAVGDLPWRGQVNLGEHTFQALGSSHQSDPVRVTVRAGPQSLRLALRARPGWVSVQAGNGWARILIDGQFVGYGYWQGELPAGQHELRIELAGFQPHAEVFTLQAGAQVTLDRRDQPRRVGAPPPERAPPERAPPVEPPPPREPEAEDDSVGVYGAILFVGTFGTSSTHQYETDCPVAGYGGSCATRAPRGGGLGLRLGYSLGVVGIEGLVIGGADVSFAQANLP
jgi:hypothetical protein